ncbi:MAG: slipin family protein [Actinobacteria bacterium]|nr:slipin family protein [Actinomycetota bacterium]
MPEETIVTLVSLLAPIIIILVIIIAASIRIVQEYERGVIFRLGRVIGAKGPGLFFIIPIIDKMWKVDLRTLTMDVPPQDIITRDNVPVRVDAVVYFRVLDPVRSVVEVSDYIFATSQISQTTLRSVLGQAELDDLLARREDINVKLREIIDEATDPWGIKVSVVEVKAVDIPQGMQRAMARQAEAERERRGKVIAAEGEFQASEKLAQAAEVIGRQPMALQLRFLQTLSEVAAEKNSTIVFPLPIELIRPFLDGMGQMQKKGS